MQGAMDRFLTLNDSSGSTNIPESYEAEPLDPDGTGDSRELSPSPIGPASFGSQRPCLYFGPQGQRCSRPALAGGFCSRHQPGTEGGKPASRSLPRIAAAGIGILAALWPIIFDILRVIARWIHAHG